ncbi:MAG TPA: hypothetical protein VIK55_00625 [Paludibacter sp.]
MKQNTTTNLALMIPSGDYYTRYIRLPYPLLTDSLDNQKVELTYLEAFLQLLVHVLHMDTTIGQGENQLLCRRGESYHSLKTWSELFHWSRSKTRHYLVKLKNDGIIELENKVTTTRLRVIHYDYYVGKATSPDARPYPEDFEKFWKQYHATTLIRAVDKEPSFRCWRKLSFDEREKAVERISRYYYSLSKTTYCVKALTYLRNKKFDDQFFY